LTGLLGYFTGLSESAEKKDGGRVAQETREAGDLMSKHQGIFGESMGAKTSSLIFAPFALQIFS
jgi:hypothetical protein